MTYFSSPVLADREGAFVPLVHRHPPNRLFDPLVQSELPERVFLGGVLLCRLAGGADLFDVHGDTERRVCFFPDFRIGPVIIRVCPIDYRIERLIMLPPLQDILGLGVNFIADTVGVRSGCCNQEEQGLHSGVTRTLGHNVIEFPVRHRVKLVHHPTMHVESMLGVGFRGAHLVEAVCRKIH